MADETPGRRAVVLGPDDADGSRLPISYGDDKLVFMARDPTRAQAQWDISAARIKDAIGSLGGGKAILRLIGVPTGHLLAEHEVCAQRGSYGVPLPEPDREYAAELAIVRNYRKVVLARSNIVQAPPSGPGDAAEPVFVSREEQRRAFELGRSLERHDGDLAGRRPLDIDHAPGTRASSGSEARLAAAVGPEYGFGSERRLAQLG